MVSLSSYLVIPYYLFFLNSFGYAEFSLAIVFLILRAAAIKG